MNNELYCKHCDSELCTDQIEAGLYEVGRCHDCATPEEFDAIDNCKDFWESKEVADAQNIQRVNHWGSEAHKSTHASIVEYAKKMNILDEIKDLEIY